jgi:hypothetical protein
MEKIVQVALDTTADHEVVVIPNIATVNPHGHTIRWTQIANEDFTFDPLTPISPPFSNVVVTEHVITARYDARGSGADKVDYKITVQKVKGPHYTTGGRIDTGGPTIKNN